MVVGPSKLDKRVSTFQKRATLNVHRRVSGCLGTLVLTESMIDYVVSAANTGTIFRGCI